MPATIHRAKFLLMRPERLLENAAISVGVDGYILQVGTWNEVRSNAGIEAEILDWGDAMLLPGLVNAHAHLELTALHGQLTHFDSFTDWALKLIRARREWSPKDYHTSLKNGALSALSSGTTLIGDITSSGYGWSVGDDSSSPSPRRVVFEETLGLMPELADSAMARIHALFDRAESLPLQTHAISPHAPYSTSGELYRKSAAFARNHNVPWTTHVAETPGELEFFETGGGEFREFLLSLGAFPDDWIPPKIHPVVWLDEMKLLEPSSLLTHGNYLDDDAIARMVRSRANAVYCPRSHAFFGHEHHPLRKLLDAGVNVALGTDSLASNDSLNMLDEMRFLYSHRRDIVPQEIFAAATASGATALGFAERLGCLDRGYCADMAVLELPPSVKSERLLYRILEGAGQCRATIINGVVAAP